MKEDWKLYLATIMAVLCTLSMIAIFIIGLIEIDRLKQSEEFCKFNHYNLKQLEQKGIK